MRALLLLTVASCWAADFSGTWTLAVDRSDFGKAQPPQSQRVTVRQTGDIFAVHAVLTDHRGESKSSYAIDATGAEVENVIRGNRVVSTANWKNGALQVRSRTELQGVVIQSSDDWRLGPDGKTLTILRTAASPQGEVRQRFVYDKSPAKR
jgi:hypothetical protein